MRLLSNNLSASSAASESEVAPTWAIPEFPALGVLPPAVLGVSREGVPLPQLEDPVAVRSRNAELRPPESEQSPKPSPTAATLSEESQSTVSPSSDAELPSPPDRSLPLRSRAIARGSDSDFDPDFESGTLAGWEVLGEASVVDSSFGVEPNSGDYQALLETGKGSASLEELEAFLEVPALEDELGEFPGIEVPDIKAGSAIKQTFEVTQAEANAAKAAIQSGETGSKVLSTLFGDTAADGFVDYLVNENSSSIAFASLVGPSESAPGYSATPIANNEGKGAIENFREQKIVFSGSQADGFSQETGYKYVSSKPLIKPGEHTVGVGVVSLANSQEESALLVDDTSNTDIAREISDRIPSLTEPHSASQTLQQSQLRQAISLESNESEAADILMA